MKRSFWLIVAWLIVAGMAKAEPRVVVLPFDPISDSLYTYYGKESVLDYRKAIQEMLVSDLSKHSEIWVVELSDLNRYIKSEQISPERWNDLKLAGDIAGKIGADYAIIGTYGEFTKEIRVDARIVVAASAEVPPGYAVSATVGLWDDIPSAANSIAAQIVPLVTAAGKLRPTSKGILFPEGEIAAYDPAGDTPLNKARLVIWVNSPAPEVTSNPAFEFSRCERIDRMNIPADIQRQNACLYALVNPGNLGLRISDRGKLPYVETLDLAAGKVYRLEVDLKTVEQMPR